MYIKRSLGKPTRIDWKPWLSPLSLMGTCVAIEEAAALYTYLAHTSDNLKENSGEGQRVTGSIVIPHQTDGLADNQYLCAAEASASGY